MCRLVTRSPSQRSLRVRRSWITANQVSHAQLRRKCSQSCWKNFQDYLHTKVQVRATEWLGRRHSKGVRISNITKSRKCSSDRISKASHPQDATQESSREKLWAEVLWRILQPDCQYHQSLQWKLCPSRGWKRNQYRDEWINSSWKSTNERQRKLAQSQPQDSFCTEPRKWKERLTVHCAN